MFSNIFKWILTFLLGQMSSEKWLGLHRIRKNCNKRVGNMTKKYKNTNIPPMDFCFWLAATKDTGERVDYAGIENKRSLFPFQQHRFVEVRYWQRTSLVAWQNSFLMTWTDVLKLPENIFFPSFPSTITSTYYSVHTYTQAIAASC